LKADNYEDGASRQPEIDRLGVKVSVSVCHIVLRSLDNAVVKQHWRKIGSARMLVVGGALGGHALCRVFQSNANIDPITNPTAAVTTKRMTASMISNGSIMKMGLMKCIQKTKSMIGQAHPNATSVDQHRCNPPITVPRTRPAFPALMCGLISASK
jgi:hypothetical protein